jgi:cellulose synthase/poly-beta-1,6-N-acetylglucosamine synthase-like glycosyltransferase
MNSLKERTTRLEWVTRIPGIERKIALLIPQYNESANFNFEERLAYFKNIADEYREQLDVIIIDDGSTDDSLKKIKEFVWKHPDAFYIATISPNANKVGALFLTTQAISHEFVILSDFDTDITGLKRLVLDVATLRKDRSLMGCYFRMLPFGGSGKVFLFQQLEYSLQRNLYGFHQKERSIRVMPGAGSCFKREVLNTIYRQHSGLRSGEDREATVIGLKLGYKTFYMDKILALTRPPLSFKALLKQRVRWNLGYIETFHKEKNYYFRQMVLFNRIGIMTLVDVIVILFTLALPMISLAIGLMNIAYLIVFVALLYVSYVAWCFKLLSVSPNESIEFRQKRVNSVLNFPVYKIFVDYFSWMGAIIAFVKKDNRSKNLIKNRAPVKIFEKKEIVASKEVSPIKSGVAGI